MFLEEPRPVKYALHAGITRLSSSSVPYVPRTLPKARNAILSYSYLSVHASTRHYPNNRNPRSRRLKRCHGMRPELAGFHQQSEDGRSRQPRTRRARPSGRRGCPCRPSRPPARGLFRQTRPRASPGLGWFHVKGKGRGEDRPRAHDGVAAGRPGGEAAANGWANRSKGGKKK